jgi:hypothetical protein
MRGWLSVDTGYVMRSARPPLYWRTLAFAGPGLLLAATLFVLGGHDALALGLVVVALALFVVP